MFSFERTAMGSEYNTYLAMLHNSPDILSNLLHVFRASF